MIIYKNRYRGSDTITISHNKKTDVFTLIFEHNNEETNKIYIGREAAKTIAEGLKVLLNNEQ